MNFCTNVSQWQISTGLQNSYAFSSITQKESVVVSAHDIISHVGDFEHFP